MAQKIIWTAKAQRDRKEILQYWRQRNKSNTYSIKLNKLFIDHVQLICLHPNIGLATSDNAVRVKIINDYLLFYEILDNQIFILTIWDSRRDPEKLKIK